MKQLGSKQSFTEYVRTLDAASVEPTAYPPEELLERVGRILQAQMRRRGLWNVPPRFLGRHYEVHGRWADPGAFQDLLWDCFLEVFFSRRYLRSLKARADAPGGDIEGMIPLNVGRFLTEHQKVQDPYGYAIFQNVKGAVQLALERDEMQVLGDEAASSDASSKSPPDGPATLGAQTVLAFHRAALDAGDDVRNAEAVPVGLTEEDARAWLGGLVTRLCATRKAVQRELAQRFPRLVERRRFVFRFGGLVTPTKKVARPHCVAVDEQAMAKIWGASGGRTDADERARLDPLTDLDPLAYLDSSVLRAIAVLDKPARTRERLTTIWTKYVELARDSDGDRLPSRNEIRREIHRGPGDSIAKSTFNDDLATLGAMVKRIRETPAQVGALPLSNLQGLEPRTGKPKEASPHE